MSKGSGLSRFIPKRIGLLQEISQSKRIKLLQEGSQNRKIA